MAGSVSENSSDLASAHSVLAVEAAALTALSRSLDGEFSAAVDCMFSIVGRVVVTGMGKSGHVGRKIAATLASTGTPSFFVHPAEASHGDLGMIMPGDVVLALSNSGETSELGDLIAYCRRFEIPLVGMTAKSNSTLARAANVALVLPPQPEACPMGLAPTTSTTMMLALGDALAVALLERKGFSAADFHRFHPGGKLGVRLLKVADLMHKGDSVPLVTEAMVMADVLPIMTAKSLGCVGVCNPVGHLAGVITDGDLRRHMCTDFISKSAQEIMTRNPTVVGPNLLAADALLQMNTRGITSLFVLEDQKPVGLLHIHDCLRAGIA